ncbi:MAG: hypothetical protein LBL66_09400 [Clostridiales bacterium]|nr:hypothetical protein [Clostridiales bacterium]
MTVGKKQVDIREGNKSAVIEHMLQGETTLVELQDKLLLSHTALNKIIRELMSQGVVRKSDVRMIEFGRPSAIYDINPDCGVAVAIALSDRYLEIFYVDMKGFEINNCCQTVSFTDADTLLDYIHAQLIRLSGHYRIKGKKISTFCVSIPAYSLFGLDLEEWKKRLAERLGDVLRDTETVFDKKTEFICIAEKRYGNLRDYADSALICDFENRISAALFSKSGIYSGIRTKPGNLNGMLGFDFWEEACRLTDLSYDELFQSYAVNLSVKNKIEDLSRPLFERLKAVLAFMDIPFLILCGDVSRLGDNFLNFALNIIGDDVRVVYSGIKNRSPACAGAVWLATYKSLKRIVLRKSKNLL